MLVQVLLYLLLTDKNIGKPTGKLFFDKGLTLAFFGDVFFITINDTFFLTGMIACMLMNIFYSILISATEQIPCSQKLACYHNHSNASGYRI